MSDLQDEIARTLAEHDGDDCFEAGSHYLFKHPINSRQRDGYRAMAAAVMPLFEREARRRDAAAYQHTCGAFWTIEPDYETPDTPCEMCGTEDAWTPLYREETP